jgi:trigger factor
MALIEGCRHELEATIPAAEVDEATEQVVTKIQAKAQLPGFRPGKVPLSIIRTKFPEEIRKEVLDVVLPRTLSKRFQAEGLAVVSTPDIVELKFEKGEPIYFKAQFEVHPEVELRAYKGLEVEYEDPSVTDADIDDRVEQIRESKAEYVNLDPRPAEAGDFVVIGIESVEGIEGEPMRNPEMQLELGSAETLPAFTEGIVGMSPGDTAMIDVTYDDDYGQERLAGKTVKFEVELKHVRRKELPELDDDFAQSMGDFRTLEEFREQVKNSIFAERQYRAQQTAKDQLLETLAKGHDFAVPETYVDRQFNNMLESYARALQQQGIDPRTLNFDMKKFRETQREKATQDVRATLLLDKIATVEAVSVEQDEVDREVQRLARSQREPAAAVRMKLEKDGGLDRIANQIRTNKTIQFLFEQARKVVPQPKPEKTEDESNS